MMKKEYIYIYMKWNFGDNYEKGYDIIENHRYKLSSM